MEKIQIYSNNIETKHFYMFIKAKTDKEKNIAIKLMEKDKQEDLQKFINLLNNKNIKEFYCKFWQSNNFYPIYKFIKEGDVWGKYFIKIGGKLSDYGKMTDDQLLYLFSQCSIKITNYEITDDKYFNFE